MRFIIAIRDRRPGHAPTTYYLSKRGLRCYDYRNVATFRTLAEAQADRDHFARDMTNFALSVERLPARLTLARAVLFSVPVEESQP